MAPSTCVSVSREVQLRPHRRCPHAFPLPSTAFRGPEGSSGTVHIHLPHPVQRFAAPNARMNSF
eukprot:8616647-Pyramimonas_sp.AAC.1